MPAPSNLVFNPPNTIVSNLPTPATITGDNIFERPNYTGRELFDVVDGDWGLNVSQVDSFIGKGAQFPIGSEGITTDIDIDDVNYIGVSMWVKRLSSDPTTNHESLCYIYSTSSNTSQTYAVTRLHSPNRIGVYIQDPSGSNWCATNILIDWNEEQYYNIISTWDGGSNLPKIFIDGVEKPIYTSSQNGSISNFQVFDKMILGNNSAYNRDANHEMCNFYGSIIPAFSNDIAKYSNIPATSVQYIGNISTQVQYTNESTMVWEIPDTLPPGTVNGAVENSTGSGAFTFNIQSDVVPPSPTAGKTIRFEETTGGFLWEPCTAVLSNYTQVLDTPFFTTESDAGNFYRGVYTGDGETVRRVLLELTMNESDMVSLIKFRQDVRIQYFQMFLGRIDPFIDGESDTTHTVRILGFSRPTRNRRKQYVCQLEIVK